MAKLVGRRYAQALFDLAIENNELESLEIQVDGVVQILLTNADFVGVINHPHITTAEKMDIISNAFNGELSNTLMGLLHVVFNKNREVDLLDMLQSFLLKAKEYRGIVTAKISSSMPLSDAQVEKIITTLSKNLDKQVEIEKIVDESLIGGLRIEVNGRVVDGTIKNQLSIMKKQLLDLQLA